MNADVGCPVEIMEHRMQQTRATLAKLYLRCKDFSQSTTAIHPKVIYAVYRGHWIVGTALNNLSDSRGSVICWCTVLQAGRSWVWFSMRSLYLSIDLIPPSRAMALGYSTSNRNVYQEFAWGVERGRRVRQTSPASLSRLSRKCGSLDVSQPYRPPLPVRDNFRYFIYMRSILEIS
jgi:hypothetical protein